MLLERGRGGLGHAPRREALEARRQAGDARRGAHGLPIEGRHARLPAFVVHLGRVYAGRAASRRIAGGEARQPGSGSAFDGSPSTASVWASRRLDDAAPRAPGRTARGSGAASRAAFSALPMATVATGIPRGIWTIESSESRPPRCWVGIGHADDRQRRLGGEHARQVGGAAGAGDDHPDPAARGRLGVAEQVVRRAMGGHDPQLARDARAASRRHRACSRHGKSERLPPTMPTTRPIRRSAIRSVLPAAARPRAGAGTRPGPRRASLADHRHVAHLAPLEHASLAVEVDVGAGVVRAPGRARRGAPARSSPVPEQVDHRRRRRAARRTRAAARGSRAGAARTGTSPRPRSSSGRELCTRGASSLIISPPPRSWNSSTVSSPTRSRPADEPVGDLARRRTATSGWIGAGATLSTRMPGVVDVARRPGTRATGPSRSRAQTTDSSASKSISRSSSSGPAGPPPSAVTAASTPAAIRDPGLAAAVVPAERHLEPATGSRARRRRRAASSTPRTSRHGAAHSPISRMNRRSASRSWVASSARQPRAQRAPARRPRRPRRGPRAPARRSRRRSSRPAAGRRRRRRSAPTIDLVGDRRRRAVRVGVEGDDPVAHRARREPEHPAQLAAAQDPDRRARRQRLGARRPDPCGCRAGTARRRTKPPLRTVYSWLASPSGAASTIRRFASAYPSRSAGSARSASRNASSSASSPRAGGMTWRWTRNDVPSWTTLPVSIGRVGGNGREPALRARSRARAARRLIAGMSSGSASIAEVDDVLARQSRAPTELPTCSRDRPGPRGRDQAGDARARRPAVARIPRVERRGQRARTGGSGSSDIAAAV